MNKELKKAIVNYMFDNATEFQLINATQERFRQYIYTEKGDYCYGGQLVVDFVSDVNKLVNNY